MIGLTEKITNKEFLRKLAKTDLEYFLMYTSHGMWKTAPHLRYLCKIIQNVAERKMRHVIVTMPPRHGKSEVISKTFPAWYLGNYPDDEVILSSYGAKLAFNFSRIARNKFSDFGSEIFNLELAKDTTADYTGGSDFGNWSYDLPNDFQYQNQAAMSPEQLNTAMPQIQGNNYMDAG